MKLTVRETVIMALLGAVMFCSKLLTEALTNIHLLAMLTIAYTVVFRAKALYPIFVFIFLTGLFYGFGVWWIPYLYLWPLLWGAAMLLPKKMPVWAAIPAYMITAGLHGLLYGTLYAPFQALVYGLDFRAMLAWIAAGFPWDVTQAIGNVAVGTLTLPVIYAIKKGMNAANI